MSALLQQWYQIKTELKQKPRLAAGVALLVFLGWVYIYLGLLDEIDSTKQSLEAEQAYYNQLLANADDESVFELSDQMASTLESYYELARRGSSEGLVEASYADDIRTLLKMSQLDSIEVQVDIKNPPELEKWPTDLRIVTANVTVRGDRKRVFQAWINLSDILPGAWYESLTVGDLDNPLVTWQMSSLVRLENSSRSSQ